MNSLRFVLIVFGVIIAVVLPQYIENTLLDSLVHVGGILIIVFSGEIATFIRKESK